MYHQCLLKYTSQTYCIKHWQMPTSEQERVKEVSICVNYIFMQLRRKKYSQAYIRQHSNPDTRQIFPEDHCLDVMLKPKRSY